LKKKSESNNHSSGHLKKNQNWRTTRFHERTMIIHKNQVFDFVRVCRCRLRHTL
jgi:hypothetical protein